MSMTSNSKTQLTNVWVSAVEDFMSMTESELDAELKELGVEPAEAQLRGKAAIEQAKARARTVQRERKRQLMEAARGKSPLTRDQAVTAEIARQFVAQRMASNDAMLTVAARKRDPRELSDEEVLALYWQIQELSR
jgi:hypothetical protein